MALQDILQAITQQADQRIQQARSTNQKDITQLRECSERTLSTKKQEIAVQKQQRKAQLKAKAENHAAMLVRNAELAKKQDLLDKTYAAVIDELAGLPDEKIEPLFRACLKSIKAKGTIHPTQKHENLLKKLADSGQFTVESSIKGKGGFRFVSDTQEQDCTLERLVEDVLRPKTELTASKMLFE